MTTKCFSICGDGRKQIDEVCDNTNKNDNKGCLSDCSGQLDGWYCSGGTPTTATTCNTQCGDGIIISLNSEICDDGI